MSKYSFGCLMLLSFALSAADSVVPKPPAEVAPPPQPSQTPQATPAVQLAQLDLSKWEHYSLVVEKNVFSKTHTGGGAGGPNSPKAIDPKAAAAAQTESEFVLVGIVQRDGKLSAFIENRKTGTSQIVRTGETMVIGKCGALTLDSVEYITANSTVVIPIGKTLAGGDPPKTGDAPKSDAPADAKTGDAEASAKPSSGNANDVLERMRKKRQEELRK